MTVPIVSCPRIVGVFSSRFPSMVWRSLPQTVQASIWTSNSPGRSLGIGKLLISKSRPFPENTAALHVITCLPIKVDVLAKVTVMILFPLKGHGENRRLKQSDGPPATNAPPSEIPPPPHGRTDHRSLLCDGCRSSWVRKWGRHWLSRLTSFNPTAPQAAVKRGGGRFVCEGP